MSRQRSSRERHKDAWHYDVDNDASSEDYEKKATDMLMRQRASKDYAGTSRMMDEYDSPTDYSDRRPRSSSKREQSLQDTVPHKTKSSLSASKNRSTTSLNSVGKQRQGKRSSQLRNDESDKSPMYDEDSRKRLNKSRRSSLSKVSDNDGSLRRKRRRRKQETSDQNELPITNVLKRAQESYTKFEEPIFPELTTDMIYVQNRNGFSAIKLRKENSGSRKDLEMLDECDSRPIKVAIIAQKAWKCTSFVCQGLLGGIAFMHLILLQTFFEDSIKFIENYGSLCEIYNNIFSFLITMCVISVFDKFDIAHLDFDHMRKIYVHHAKSAIAIFLYTASFFLHQITYKVNDKMILIHYKSLNLTEAAVMKNDTLTNSLIDDLPVWQKVTVSKDVLVVLAWFFISLGTQDDIFLASLKDMAKSEPNLTA